MIPDDRAVEPGDVVLADRHDRDAPRLEVLEGRRHVEDRLRSGAHDGHGGPAEFLEVGRDVEAGRAVRPGLSERAPVDAADAAGREDPDARRVGRDHRRRDRGGGPAALGQGDREAGPGGLANGAGRRGGEGVQGVGIEAHQHAAIVDRHRGRDRATLADGGLRGARDLDVLWIRQAVADEGGLEGDDGRAVAQRAGDLGRDQEPVGCHVASLAERRACGMVRRTAPNRTRLGA